VAAQVLFETFNVPALYCSVQAVLSLYASGKTTGLVLDSGDGVTHAVPVYQGFSIPNSIRRIDVAGRDVTEHLQMQLRKGGHIFHTSAEKEIVKSIKESTGYVALDIVKEEKDWAGSRSEGKSIDYTLPDGQKLKVSRRCCITAHRMLIHSRLVLSAFVHPRSSSIPSSSVWSIRACIRSSSRRSRGPTWTFGKLYMAISCFLVVPR